VRSRRAGSAAAAKKSTESCTDRYLAIPVFLGIMFVTFWLTFNVFGAWLSDLLTLGSRR
jgi:ferrous iron transport protein B